jgi:hypothetical protein
VFGKPVTPCRHAVHDHLASVFAEYQARDRVDVDMVEWYPFHGNVVQPAIRGDPPVALVDAIIQLFIAAPVSFYSALSHSSSSRTSHSE